MSASAFQYLVRFLDQDGQVVYGNLPQYQSPESLVGTSIRCVSGDLYGKLEGLCPLESTPIVQCIGVNYAKHAAEANFAVPKHPVVFAKPADALAGPFDVIYCPPDSRPMLDYEGELCFIFNADAKDVPESRALDYILGYTIGNDLSARNWISMEMSGMQMSYGKSFDGFAPVGPYIVSPSTVGDPHNLRLTTKINGEVRQDDTTGDMIWNLKQIITHLTNGRTVRKGTVVMTGTPSGVGWFMKPTGFVGCGDSMEIYIEKLGTLSNNLTHKSSCTADVIRSTEAILG